MIDMTKTELLNALDLGGVVAEQDPLLANCFIRHPVLSEVITDRKDLVLGAKGAGKSAAWKEMFVNQVRYPELSDVLMKVITNPSGDPEFRDVLAVVSKSGGGFDEEELRNGWRLYFLAQLWRWAQEVLPDSEEKEAFGNNIKKYGLAPRESSRIKEAFAYAMAKAKALNKIEVEWLKGFVAEFEQEALNAGGSAASIPFNELFETLNVMLNKQGIRIWLILDRLDEIVIGNEQVENLVLKGLLLAYRDVSDYANARVKIFLRDDVFNRVTTNGHFPALTHVKSRAAGPIKWNYDDLMHLIVQRLLNNKLVTDHFSVSAASVNNNQKRSSFYYQIFPKQVDKGRAAEGFKWVVDRITDGKGVATPRDLISVLEAAKNFQLEQIMREGESIDAVFVSGDSLRKAVRKIAKENLETRIYAEYPDLRQVIEKFQRSKADHNLDTLGEKLGDRRDELMQRLERIGVIYQRNRKGVEMWTFPFLFSYALDITRGAAFELPAGVQIDAEED